mmetsp:Transcript_36102/g.113549  ORF Transcript_36102/g.113549 Transcript_36102/m.113549 type:complete len:212 (-) Transcript_36102:694-1329(-)
MEERPASGARLEPVPVGVAVERVAEHRVARICEVDSDLVRAAGPEEHRDQGEPAVGGDPVHDRERLARVCAVAAPHRHPKAVRGVAADRRVDHCAAVRLADADGEVDLPHAPRRKGGHELPLRTRSLGRDDGTRGEPVEAVHHTGPEPRARHVGEQVGGGRGGSRAGRGVGPLQQHAVEQAVDEGAAPVAGRRVDDEPGLLVEHYNVLVLE